MTRKLKAFGVALVAAFALSAAAASAAQAEVLFHSNVGTTFGTVTQIGTNQFDTGAGNWKCKTVGGTAMMIGSTGTTVRLVPSYWECTAFGLPVTTDMNGCSYLTTSHGVMHIDCPTTAGGVTDTITVTVLPGTPHEVCVLHFPEQTMNATYATEGLTPARDVKVTPTATTLTYIVTYPTGQTEGKCGSAGLHHDGGYTGSLTVRGFKNEAHNEAADLWVE